jgi:uncharacterized protein (TIGR02300 family)
MALGAPDGSTVSQGVGEVAKPEWGTKRTCLSCGTKFYDFSREPIACPSCEAIFKVETPGKPKRSPRPQVKAAPVAEVVVKVAEPVDDENGDAVANDDAAIEEGDEDLALVAEAGLIGDEEKDEDEDDADVDSVLEADGQEDIEAELNSEIDADLEKESEG